MASSSSNKSGKATTFLWSFLEQGGSKAIQLFVQIILARLLYPENFGILGNIVGGYSNHRFYCPKRSRDGTYSKERCGRSFLFHRLVAESRIGSRSIYRSVLYVADNLCLL